MSNYLIKSETLTNIANAIRGKTGKTESIPAYNMASEISGISSGLTINGIIEQYKVQAGKTVNAGDFVEFVNAVSWGSGEFSSSLVTGNEGYGISAVALSNSKVLVTYYNTNYYGTAVVLEITNGNVAVGSSTVFHSSTTNGISAVALSENKVLVAYSSTSTGYAQILTISGTTITTNTATSFISVRAQDISAVALNETKALIAYRNQNTSYGDTVILTVSGTTISKGTATTFNSAYTGKLSAVTLNENKVLVAYCDTDNSSYGKAIILTINGTTISKGTATTFNSANTAYSISTVALSESKVLVAYSYGTSYGTAQILTISGTTITTNTAKNFNSSRVYSISTVALSDSSVLVAYEDYSNSQYGRAIILSIDGTTITVGTKTTLNSSATTAFSCIAFSSTSVTVFYVSTGGLYKTFKISGTTITTNNQIESETLVQPSETVINGVANTSGTAGETVEVYVPTPKGYTVTLIADYGTNNGQYSIDGGTTWVTIPVGQTTTLSNVETIMFKCASGYGANYHTIIGTSMGSNNIALLADTQTSANITLTADTTYYISEYTTSDGGGGN